MATGQTQYLTLENLIGILGRSIALGITAIGQTFAILVASIDLSVANLISASAVLASVIMNGDPAMVVPAILAVLALGAVVGVVNGLDHHPARGEPAHRHARHGADHPGLLSRPSTQLRRLGAHRVPGLRLRRNRRPADERAVSGRARRCWAGSCCASPASAPTSTRSAAIADAARLAGIKTARVIIAAHVICSLCAAVAGLYLASRLRSGAPWIGRDGVYDLESIAVVVIGGTVLAGGRGGVWGTIAGVMIFSLIDSIFNLAGVDAFAKQVLRGIIIVAAVAFYAVRSKRIVA